VPLSEEEQRILHEMEQKLYEHDRAFVDRVSTVVHRHRGARPDRWPILTFVGGFALLVLSFRSSVVLGALGFVVMLISALAFAQRSIHPQAGASSRERRSGRGHSVADEWSEMRRRFRSRFSSRG